jgi:DNA repair photolyase
LRLPLELKELFREWLQTELPERAARAINILRSMHGGKDYTPEWRVRQRGRGPYADQIGLRFRMATKRLGLNERNTKLRIDLFQRPVPKGKQIPLL